MYLIYLPAYNEEAQIGETIKNIQNAVKNRTDIDILIVDDGSTDRTSQIAFENNVMVITHQRNFGVGKAFQTAVNFAISHNYLWMVTIDADGQFDPVEIPKLVERFKVNQASLVTGNRFHNGKPENMSSIKYWGNHLVCTLVNKIAKLSLHDVSCGFRAYNREALLQLNLYGSFTYTHETILSLANKEAYIDEVPVHVKYFPERSSRIANNLLSYASHALRIIGSVLMHNYALPVFGTLSALFTLVGLGFEIYLLIHYFSYGMFTPYKSLGFIGLGFIILGLFLLLFALLANLMNRLNANQERILYFQKKHNGKIDGKE